MRRAFRITGAVAGVGLSVSSFAQGELVPGVFFGLTGVALAVRSFPRFDLVRRPWTADALQKAIGLRIFNALLASGFFALFVVVVVLAVQADEARRGGLIVSAVAVGFFAALVGATVILSELWLWRRRRRRHDSTADQESGGHREGPPGSGITFYREDVLMYAMVSYKIDVDGQQVGVLRPASSLAVPLPPGVYSCRARVQRRGSAAIDIEVSSGDEVRVLVRAAALLHGASATTAL